VGPLRLAAISTVAPFVLSSILPVLARDWPRLKLYVRDMLTSAACDATERGDIDCVLLALPVECGNIEKVDVAVDRLILVTANGQNQSASPRCEAGDQRLLLLEDGRSATKLVQRVCIVASPGAEQLYGRHEVLPERRQLVLDRRWDRALHMARDEPHLLRLAQRLNQHLLGSAGQATL
jgi:DNA-binding transcriptional LysR family regulator